ncbi:hypothetical protein A2Y99_03960 [Candidatus Gottesmanbacteria bacterium RBG_13_37_7]|uniref:Glycosyltransferase 2-like domain-containing protein n=1 Tax=Candidatus Gottesmanbacteria bacterium RBG_13_37_7 TaxID=1798369 RepID=A0A1F5YIG5_9BACT|nr:MAG: hypothetical protein A2Y99_03960 [Candidatus Gottesmanbacteria bacterium RBG_13_37_7]
MRILIGIPAYNESKMIGQVISRLPKNITGFGKADILVVDDGSSDNTGEIAREKGATVLTHLINRGLGGALKTIFQYARTNGYDVLVTFDADGQHDAKDIGKLVKLLTDKSCDFIVGTRWSKGLTKPYTRYYINMLANIFTYVFFNIKTTDSQSGFRAFGKKAIQSVSISTDGMEVSSEFFREAKRCRFKFAEVPIKAVYSVYSKGKGQSLSDAPEVFMQLLLRLLK